MHRQDRSWRVIGVAAVVVVLAIVASCRSLRRSRRERVVWICVSRDDLHVDGGRVDDLDEVMKILRSIDAIVDRCSVAIVADPHVTEERLAEVLDAVRGLRMRIRSVHLGK